MSLQNEIAQMSKTLSLDMNTTENEIMKILEKIFE